MGYKAVDGGSDDTDEGFKYTNHTGDDEFVTLGVNGTVEIRADSEYVNIWVEDIPNLMKALKAAYDTYPY
jgi:hypothetical protein